MLRSRSIFFMWFKKVKRKQEECLTRLGYENKLSETKLRLHGVNVLPKSKQLFNINQRRFGHHLLENVSIFLSLSI